MRSVQEDAALRAHMNSVIASYNQGERTVLSSQCQDVLDTYFKDGQGFSSDVDVLEVMFDFLTEIKDDAVAARALGVLSAVRPGPILSKIDDSKLNEESRYLLEYSKDRTSQSGEDGILEKIFTLIGIENKWCVEFGAYDGMLHSNTYSLVADDGWHGVLIEGDSDRYDELVRTFQGNDRAYLMRKLVGFDRGVDSLDDILASTEIPTNPDLVSIDIDGNDWHVWFSCIDYRPRVVIVEFNPTIPNDVLFIQSRDEMVTQGCSLRALISLGKAKGYELACATIYNGIFVLSEDFPKLGIEDNSIDAMYKPIMDGRIFHCYDAKIYTVGMNRLNWSMRGRGLLNRPIKPDELQLSLDP